jgi:DNA-directed RNA polymerase III subunit RPC1
MKEQLIEQHGSKKISHIQFGLLPAPSIAEIAKIEIYRSELYDVPERTPVLHGCLDKRLGVSDRLSNCETCGQKTVSCPGHFGHISLELPIFHVGYLKATITTLQNICKYCSKVLLNPLRRDDFLRKFRNPNLDFLQRRLCVKLMNELCKKTTQCYYCGEMNGTVKKVGVFRIIHDESSKNRNNMEYIHSFDEVIEQYPDLKTIINKSQEDLNPLRVLELFQNITDEDCELLGFNPEYTRPEDFLLTQIPVPPAVIRPSVAMESGAGSNEDDITVKLSEIVAHNAIIRDKIRNGARIDDIMTHWDLLHVACATYINSEYSGLSRIYGVKPSRGLCQRLKGKGGRFRGNLSGKRVDFSARTVISPDPNLGIDEVAIPELIAKILTYPEMVFEHNIEKLRQRIINGPEIHPGANYVQSSNGMKRYLKYVNKEMVASQLKIGDIVERHIQNGDIVLFNRQPSLHKLSIMCHIAKIRPWKTFRFNECVCAPYNADFDGDEMNIHVPQTEEARIEAKILMDLKDNLVTPRNGELLVAPTQDFLTASYLISQKDYFMTEDQFMNMCCWFSDGLIPIDLPLPTILKPFRLYSGKQVFSSLLKPNKLDPILVNLETKCKTYTSQEEFCPQDGYLFIRNSEVLSGVMDKTTIGANKNSLCYIILRDYGSLQASIIMNRIAKLCSRFLTNYGFSIGINDVEPSYYLTTQKNELIKKGYSRCNEYIQQLHSNTLQVQTGATPEETLESVINRVLSQIREDAGQLCLKELSRYNTALIMALCGSKGSNINISQMIACVGQQTVSGTRVPEGFLQRTLPHFPINSKTPEAKGFVHHSFYTGLTPTEFFFHTMAGREGLVDTAVKTAETGYMQRRLMKALEDVTIQYDNTVRNATNDIIQFSYGDDSLNPTNMEGKNRPVDFQRTWLHCMVSFSFFFF